MTARRKKREQMKPRSAAFEAIHSAATGLHKTKVIDKTIMREFDKTCLMPISKYKR